MIRYNYGITGQPEVDYYNEFLGFGKKARRRRKERRARKKARKDTRLRKKQLQNQEKQSEIERIRAETKLMQQTAAPTRSITLSGTQPQPPPPQKAGFGGGAMIILGILVVGGIIYQAKGKKGAAVNVPPV